MNTQQIIKNIQMLYDTYGGKIVNDKQLLLAYWKIIDKVEMDKDSISTKSFLELATAPEVIINGKILLDALKMSEEE